MAQQGTRCPLLAIVDYQVLTTCVHGQRKSFAPQNSQIVTTTLIWVDWEFTKSLQWQPYAIEIVTQQSTVCLPRAVVDYQVLAACVRGRRESFARQNGQIVAAPLIWGDWKCTKSL